MFTYKYTGFLIGYCLRSVPGLVVGMNWNKIGTIIKIQVMI